METLEIILDKVCDELEEYGKKLQKDGKMSAGDLEMVNKLIDIKKNILKTWKLEDEDGGYSQAGDWEGMARGHFGDYSRNYDEGGNSYRGRRRDSMGRYSREGRGGNRGGRGGYSRNGGDLMEHMDMMMEEAETPQEKELIRRFKKELERV